MRDDRSRGKLRSLESYQRIFSGYEDLVAEVYGCVLLESLHGPGPAVRKPTSFGSVFDRLADGAPRDFSVEGEVGRGGMAVVLKIHDERLHRDLAMKLIPGEVGMVGSQGSTRETPAVHRRRRARSSPGSPPAPTAASGSLPRRTNSSERSGIDRDPGRAAWLVHPARARRGAPLRPLAPVVTMG